MRTKYPTLAFFGVALTLLIASEVLGAEKVLNLPIVNRAIEFHGGDLYTSTRTSLTVGSKSGSFDLVCTMDGGQYEHVVVGKTSKGVDRKVRLTNDSVEEWRGGELVPLDEESRRRARSFVEARVYFPFLPFRLNDPQVWKEDQGIETWKGRELHRVKVTFGEDSSQSAHDEYVFWFHPKTGKLEQYAYSYGTGSDSGGLRFRELYNYRLYSGMLFFDAENIGVEGSGKELRVELLTPEYVEEKLKPVSFVKLTKIQVKPIADP